MSMLGYYIRRAEETKGIQHQSTIAALRQYIRTTPKSEVLEAIALIDRRASLKILWEAGLDTELQQAVLKRYQELT